MKHELAGGVMPGKYFGANAAWLRLAATAQRIIDWLEAARRLPIRV